MKNYHRTILSILSVLFLFLSFRELGFFAWFSLIPFLFIIYNSNLKQTLLFSFICGMGFFIGVTYWMNNLPVKYVWLLLTPLLSIIFLIYGTLIYFIFKKIHQPILRIFLIPAVWVFIEFVRSQTLLAFTIGILGYTQHNFLPLMQITRFTGIYGVSFVIILFNITIFETILFLIKNKKVTFRFLIICISILVVFVTYGIISVNNNLNRVISYRGYSEIKLALVQPNISLRDKYSEKGMEIIPEPYCEETYFRKDTDMVVFPESMLWGLMEENEGFKDWVKKISKTENLYMLIGQYTHDDEFDRYYDSALLYDPDMKITGRYDETHPVPFSQYMPYPKILSFLRFLDFSVVNLIPGRDYNTIDYPDKGKIGVNICFESTIPSIARKVRNNDAEAIFILSDNASLGDSIAPWHHLIFSKVRAIENGCYVVHCANTGISAIISPDGELVARSDLLNKTVFYGSVFLIKEKTFYAKYGDMLLIIYIGTIFLLTIVYFILKKLKKIS